MHTTHTPLIVALAVLAIPFAADAGEIHYGSLKDQHENTLLIEYKGPSAGPDYYTCDISTKECESEGEETPDLFPSVLGSKSYVKSADGTLAVKPMVVGTRSYYFLYDISGSKAAKKALIPYSVPGAKVYISKNSGAVVFKKGNMYTRYDIATKKLSRMTLRQELSFFSLSPDAGYVTGYNYNTGKHELWRFSDGKVLYAPSSMQSYVEFSEDEEQLAFLEDVDSFKTLFIMDSDELGKANPTSLRQLTEPDTEIEDYLFIDSTLYFMANVDGPLEWDLFAHTDGETELVDTDVSYGDYLKRVRADKKDYLAYLKTTGKNTNVVLLSPNPGEPVTLTGPKSSSASKEVEREVVEYGDRTGVLLSPADGGSRDSNLFIWMRGGPQRQVAKSYHPYLSYAVYDELLERLVEGGNYVYKIDYTGSSGYGADFRKALTMNVGDVEMDDIENAIEEIVDDVRVDNVYLIGNSYGGYMAFRGIVDFPDLVDGAISINGVSDWYGLIQTIPSSPFKKVFNGVPDSHNLDEYFQASVFLGMEELSNKHEVLVVWGEEDSTVPVSQSTHYIEYAETQNVNVSSLSFQGEDHIIRERENLDKLCKKIVSVFNLDDVSCAL